ncbi:MAG: ParB N-terminal domain-containing protein [Elusimicrobiota bacterium]
MYGKHTPEARVTRVLVKNIIRNPHNPRRLFDEEPMRLLQDSIKQLGILVPLSVYPAKEHKADPLKDKFILLDGERRWRCATELGLRRVPVIVHERPSDIQNILTMFHIHNVREGWQLMPTALKLRTLMKKLRTHNERKLAVITQLSLSQIRRCKILLTYPLKYQNRMLAPASERYKSDFFIDLQRIRGIALEKRFKPWVDRGDSACIDIMMEKFDANIIKSVTEFRALAALYRGAVRQKKVPLFLQELDRFFRHKNLRIDDLRVPGASYEREMKEIGRSARRLYTQIRDFDLENIASDRELIEMLRDLKTLIEKKLASALLDRPSGKTHD